MSCNKVMQNTRDTIMWYLCVCLCWITRVLLYLGACLLRRRCKLTYILLSGICEFGYFHAS